MLNTRCLVLLCQIAWQRTFQKSGRNNLTLNFVIVLDESGELISQVDKKTGNAWQPLIILNIDETVLLQTRIRNGYISSDKKDVLYRHSN